MRIKKRTLFISLISFFLIIIISGVVYYFNQKIYYTQKIYSDVHETIKITRDKSGFPTITANTLEDVYFAIGYAHSQDQYLLMEYYRSIAIGGNTTISEDDERKLRKIIQAAGIQSRALEILSAIKSPHIDYLNAFVKGINKAQKQWIRTSSIEKEWEAVDIIAILLMREWSNSFLNNRELFFPILDTKIDSLYSVIMPQNFMFSYTQDEKKGIEFISSMRKLIEEYIGTFNRGFAFSVEDKIAVSYETAINSYPTWYPVQININQQEIKAITNVGLPFLFSGQNEKISFAGFSCNTSTQNFFIETTHRNESIVQYRSRGILQDFKTIYEPNLYDPKKINTDVVFKTDIGPVINDIFENSELPDKIFTMQSILPSERYIISLFDMPFSETIGDAIASARRSDSLPKTFIFSDKSQTSKIYTGISPRQNNTGQVFLKPTDFSNDIINISLLPQRFNSNIIASTFFEDAPELLRRNSIHETVKFERLNQLLVNINNRNTKSQAKDILVDDFSVFAEKLVPYFRSMLQVSPTTSAKLMRIYFKDWDYKYSIDQVQPSLFEALMRNFIDEIISDKFFEIMPLNKAYYALLMERLTQILLTTYNPINPNNPLTLPGDVKADIFDRAFLKSLRELNSIRGPIMNEWIWGEIHRGNYTIHTRYLPMIARLFYSIKTRPFIGGSSTLMASAPGIEYKPKKTTSLYGVIGLSHSQLTANYTCSTNPFSKFYFGKSGTIPIGIFDEKEPVYVTTIMPLSEMQ